MSDAPDTGSETATGRTAAPADRLDGDPRGIDGHRVLGVVPGRPVAGDRKEPPVEDLVMVWPHLLVRHAVAAVNDDLAPAIRGLDATDQALGDQRLIETDGTADKSRRRPRRRRQSPGPRNRARAEVV